MTSINLHRLALIYYEFEELKIQFKWFVMTFYIAFIDFHRLAKTFVDLHWPLSSDLHRLIMTCQWHTWLSMNLLLRYFSLFDLLEAQKVLASNSINININYSTSSVEILKTTDLFLEQVYLRFNIINFVPHKIDVVKVVLSFSLSMLSYFLGFKIRGSETMDIFFLLFLAAWNSITPIEEIL